MCALYFLLNGLLELLVTYPITVQSVASRFAYWIKKSACSRKGEVNRIKEPVTLGMRVNKDLNPGFS